MTTSRALQVAFVFVMVGCISDQGIAPSSSTTGTPDLVIDTVTFARLPNCWQGYPSGIICGGPRFDFTLHIRNVGSGNFTVPFYISNSRSNVDLAVQYCSFTIRVNDPAASIPPGGTLDVTYESFVDDSTSRVHFVINTNDRFDTGVPLPRVDELSYDNNDYYLPLVW